MNIAIYAPLCLQQKLGCLAESLGHSLTWYSIEKEYITENKARTGSNEVIEKVHLKQRVLILAGVLVRQSLVGYLQKQIQAGVVLPLPADLLAQMVWGILFSYVINQSSYECPGEAEHNEEEIIAFFATIFVRGTCASEKIGGSL